MGESRTEKEAETDEEEDAVDEYWKSEHHRFEYGEHADALCEDNPLSYHQVGLAIPGTFVKSRKLYTESCVYI